MALYPLPIARWAVAAVAVLFFLVIPLTLHEYYLSIVNLVWIAVIGALGLNILVGYTGQVSIGHGAFMSVGAYTAANLAIRLDSPWPVNLAGGRAHGRRSSGPSWASRPCGSRGSTWPSPPWPASSSSSGPSTTSPSSAAACRPPSRWRGPRLGLDGASTPSATCTTSCSSSWSWPSWATMNLVRSRIGRAFIAIRDHDIAAEIIGINIFRYKLLAFAISSFYAGVTGRALHLLPRHRQLRAVPDRRLHRLPGHDHHRGAGLRARLDLRRHLRHPAAHRHPLQHGGLRGHLPDAADRAQPHPQPPPHPVRGRSSSCSWSSSRKGSTACGATSATTSASGRSRTEGA